MKTWIMLTAPGGFSFRVLAHFSISFCIFLHSLLEILSNFSTE
jgi:hypothetical protein